MDKPNIGDKVLDKLHQRREKVQQVLMEQYRKTRPFRMEPVSNDQHIYIYQNMTPEDLQYAVQTYGRDAVNEWIFEVEKKLQRRQGNAST